MRHLGAAVTHARQQRHSGGCALACSLAGRGEGRSAAGIHSWVLQRAHAAAGCLHYVGHSAGVHPHLICCLSCPDSILPQLMQADTFDLHSFHTLTGTTFMLLAEPQTPDAAELLRTT